MTSPLLTLLKRVDAALDSHVDTPVFGLDETELVEAMSVASRVACRIGEVELRLAHQAAASDVDVKTAWVRQSQQTPRAAAVRLKLAAAIDTREPLRLAMAAGRVTEAQARVLVHALDRLPDRLDLDVLQDAEAHLIGLCDDHHPDELRRLGRHLLRVVAPEIAEAEEARQVDAEYRHAVERCRLTLSDRGDGCWEGRFVLPAAQGHRLAKLMAAFGSPGHRAATGRRLVLGPQRAGEAFGELIDRYPTDQTPPSAGASTRVIVDLSLDDLTTKLTTAGVATLDGIVDVPAWVARRTACEAGILPAVLGGQSQVLDLGRARRLHSEAQRIVIFKRDKSCRAEGCDWPAHQCHVHHPHPWSRGGPTTIANAMTLCPRHHTRAHDPTYEMAVSKHGTVVFRRT